MALHGTVPPFYPIIPIDQWGLKHLKPDIAVWSPEARLRTLQHALKNGDTSLLRVEPVEDNMMDAGMNLD